MLIAKAPTLTILVACADSNGVLRFPSAEGPFFGIPARIDQSLPVTKQAVKAVAEYLQSPELPATLKPLSLVEPVLRLPNVEPSLLFLMRAPGLMPDAGWRRLVDVLRELPQGSNRVAYNKAFQYFAGAAEADIDILEVDGEVKQRIRELMGESGQSLLS